MSGACSVEQSGERKTSAIDAAKVDTVPAELKKEN